MVKKYPKLWVSGRNVNVACMMEGGSAVSIVVERENCEHFLYVEESSTMWVSCEHSFMEEGRRIFNVMGE